MSRIASDKRNKLMGINNEYAKKSKVILLLEKELNVDPSWINEVLRVCKPSTKQIRRRGIRKHAFDLLSVGLVE